MRNFKKLKLTAKITVFLLAALAINSFLNYIFIPYSYIRVDYHNIEENSYDMVFVGTSHGKCGIDPSAIDSVTGKKSVNMCLGGEYLSYTYYKVKEICRHHVPEEIVYEIDGGYWTTEEYIGTDSCSIFREMKWSGVKAEFFLDRLLDKDFRVTLFPWYLYRKKYRMIPENIKNKFSGSYQNLATDVFTNTAQEYRENGFIYCYPVADKNKGFQNFTEWNSNQVQTKTEEYFKKLVKFCKEKEIKLTLLIIPVPDMTREMYKQQYQEQHEYFTELAEKYELRLLDFNYESLDGFDKSLAAYIDCEGHLNGEAAIEFSKRLGEYLTSEKKMP
ncbi:MAG: hypothetical protein HFH63_04425 [Lachnospiraceae bacterium]|nr:hypothetical protein [Lachnospiraceae bacterium]